MVFKGIQLTPLRSSPSVSVALTQSLCQVKKKTQTSTTKRQRMRTRFRFTRLSLSRPFSWFAPCCETTPQLWLIPFKSHTKILVFIQPVTFHVPQQEFVGMKNPQIFATGSHMYRCCVHIRQNKGRPVRHSVPCGLYQ